MRQLLFIFFVLVQLSVSAQKPLKVTLEEYLKIVETKDSEKIMDYMYPKFFELYPREMMVKVMDQSMKDPSLEIELMDSKILEISEAATVDSITFSKVSYSFVMTMKYVVTADNPAPEDETINFTKNIFDQMYGKENVSFNAEMKKFRIFAKKEMLALKTPRLSEWKVLGLEENLKPILKKIIPDTILSQL
jgi:hypothetical protein